MPGLIVARKRASTRAVLGEEYRPVPRTDPPLPPPLKSIEDLTEERLKMAISYADERLRSRRTVTSVTERALRLYKSAAKEAFLLGPGDDDAKVEVAANLRAYESEFGLRTALKTRIHVRYKDYLALVCERLKTQSRINETLNWQKFYGWNVYWTNINAKLQNEDWKGYLPAGPSGDRSLVKMNLAVRNACGLIGIDSEDMLKLIALYADRNDLVHQSLDSYVNRGMFNDLAQSLARDLKQLPAIIPSHLNHLQSLYQNLIITVIEENFDIIDLENPQTWIAKDTVKRAYLSYQEKEKWSAANAEKMRLDIAKAATKRFEQKVKARVLVMQAALSRPKSRENSSVSRSLSPSKRQASQEHPDSVARHQEGGKQHRMRQLKEWQKLMAIQQQANRLADAYEDDYGVLEEPDDHELETASFGQASSSGGGV